MRLEIASHKAIKYACMNFHYAKAIPVNTFGYSVFNEKDEWCGVVLYGTGANNNLATQYKTFNFFLYITFNSRFRRHNFSKCFNGKSC